MEDRAYENRLRNEHLWLQYHRHFTREMIYAVLKICRNKAKKTDVISKACLSYTGATLYLKILSEKGLIKQTFQGDHRLKIFHITEKGEKFIVAYESPKVQFESLDRMLE